jgi:hypothetical protein
MRIKVKANANGNGNGIDSYKHGTTPGGREYHITKYTGGELLTTVTERKPNAGKVSYTKRPKLSGGGSEKIKETFRKNSLNRVVKSVPVAKGPTKPFVKKKKK